MKDLDDILGLSVSEWKRIKSTNQAQEAFLYFCQKQKDTIVNRLTNADTIEDFFTLKGQALVVNEIQNKIIKKRKDNGAKADTKTILPFRT